MLLLHVLVVLESADTATERPRSCEGVELEYASSGLWRGRMEAVVNGIGGVAAEWWKRNGGKSGVVGFVWVR